MKTLIQLTLASLTLLVALPVMSATLYVEVWSNGNEDCGARQNPCWRIQDAIDKSQPNGKIKVGPGLYRDNLVIDTNLDGVALTGLTLESTAGRYATIITQRVGLPPAHIVEILQSKVRLGRKGKGFTLSGPAALDGVHIGSPDVSQVRIEGNYAVSTLNGFNLQGEKHQVRNNLAEATFDIGFRCLQCDGVLFRDNASQHNQSVSNAEGGFAFVDSPAVTMQRNLAYENDAGGIDFDSGSPGMKLKDNVALRNRALAADVEGIDLRDIHGALIQGNIASRQIGRGFALDQLTYEGKTATIKNNLSVGNSEEGIVLGSLEGKLDGNYSADNVGGGFLFEFGAGPDVLTIKSFRNNNSYGDAEGRGIQLNRSSVVMYSRHFFGSAEGPDPDDADGAADGNDAALAIGGGTLTGSFAKKVNAFRAKAAAKL